MALPELSKVGSGVLGISQAQNVAICSVVVDKGRYVLYGSTRHTLADGVKVSAGPPGSLVDIATIPNAPTGVGIIPSIVIDSNAKGNVVVLRLAVATGGADNASGVVSCQLLQSI